MYSAFARLNYKAWFAIAEFVDNAIQSFLQHRDRMPSGPLQVEISIDDDEIVVSDRAGGIAWNDFPRAFSPSQPPPDATGLSEFGLGMKAAACWFAKEWSVRTSAIGEPIERSVRFDVERITSSNIEHLPINTRAVDEGVHYTTISLRNLRVRPKGRTIGKIKDHLCSIYRVLMEKGHVRITVTSAAKTEELAFDRPDLLKAPFYKDPTGNEHTWKRDFEISLPEGRTVKGWAGLLAKGSTSRAGFSVFRRDRLIQGSADETYRPLRIFRSPNTYTYQRLVGELFVDGFDVSHTKDGIQWAGLEDEMLSQLKEELNSGDLPMLSQAEGYRVRQRAAELPKGFGAEALHGAGAEIKEGPKVKELLTKEHSPEDIAEEDKHEENQKQKQASADPIIHESFEAALPGVDETWLVKLQLISDPPRPWYGFEHFSENGQRGLHVWLNLAHPFSESYVNSDENTLSPLVRLVAAMSLAEHAAQKAGVRRASAIRNRVNELLLETFGDHEDHTS